MNPTRPLRWPRWLEGSLSAPRRDDLVVLAVVGVYGLAAVIAPMSWAGMRQLNSLLYALISIAAIWQMARTARAAQAGSERLAWILLAIGAFARFASGLLWDALGGTGPGSVEPAWLIPVKVSYLAFALPALLVFPSAPWRGRDAERARLDALTVLVGSFLIVWYLAIGPLLRNPLAATAPLDDRLMVFGDSLAVLLAASLHLRARAAAVRAAGRWLLVAMVLRVVPDLLIWRADAAPDLSAFSAIDAIWFVVWALQWGAARTAEAMSPPAGASEAAPAAQPERYASGIVPHGFLLAAVAALLVQVVAGESADVALFTIGSAALALLLVTRQGIELDERDGLAQRLEREGARYEALLRHAYDAVVMFDPDGRLSYASPATVRTYGTLVGLGDPERLIGIVHPDDQATLLAALAAPPAGALALRVRARDRAGRWHTLEGHLHDHRDDPLVRAIVLNGVDRTREARLAEGLAEAQPLEALGVLAGGLAHDLNNILTVVASHAELLDADAALDPRAREDVRAIRAASDRAQTLTRGLLTLSRRKQGPVASVAIASAVRDAIDAVPGAALAVAPGEVTSVLADPSAVAQVIDGLFEAVRDEHRAGPVQVAVGERAVEEDEGTLLGVEPRLYVAVSVGAPPRDDAPVVVEDAVRVEAGHEWDLAPGDLALLIALAASRELGGTVLRERQGDLARYVALLPAVHQ